jgi:hypothetical protein
MERDCMLYKASNKISLDNSRNSFSSLEEINIENSPHNITEITYSWIDPIKIHGKVIARRQNDAHFWVMPNQLVICFGSSESAISYAIGRFTSYTGVKLVKLDPYGKWVNKGLRTDKWSANLVEITIYKLPSPLDGNSERTLRHSEPGELLSHINPSDIASLTFAWARKNMSSLYFHLDNNSMISFYDTTRSEEILDVVREISKWVANC